MKDKWFNFIFMHYYFDHCWCCCCWFSDLFNTYMFNINTSSIGHMARVTW